MKLTADQIRDVLKNRRAGEPNITRDQFDELCRLALLGVEDWGLIRTAPLSIEIVWLAFTNCPAPWVAKGRKNGAGDWLNADTMQKFKYDSEPTHWMSCQKKPLPPASAES